MYPFLRTAYTVIKARYRSRLDIEETAQLSLRVGFSDVDIFGELNNARHLSVMELGRWDHTQRLGLLPVMRKHNWGFVVGGVSIRFRRRIPFWAKYTLSTQIISHDGRWFYLLQETSRNGQICSSALIKAGAISKDGLVNAPRVLAEMNREDWAGDMPAWIVAWIEAEGQRPWPATE